MSELLDEIVAYVALDASERALLRELHTTVAPQLPEIADRFHVAIVASPRAAAVLAGSDQIEHHKRALIDWMSTGLRGPYDDAFYETRSRIGRRHVEVGLPQHYMFTAMNVVRTAYLDTVLRAYDHDRACAVVRAVNKLLDIELAVLMRHYQIDSEERLVKRERQIASERLAAMQTLTSGLAHEVRNPLNSARLQLDLLKRRLQRRGDDSQLLEPAELAGHEIARLTELLDDFLAFARPPALHRREVDLVAVCRQAVEVERPLADERAIELACVDAPSVVGRVDSERLCQAVQHLVRNAIEAAPHDGHVRVDVIARDRNACIRVTDDGPGIPRDVLPHVFEPFYSTKQDGTGMGMAIAHSLVTMHGGHVEIDTTSRGTTIEIVLPTGG